MTQVLALIAAALLFLIGLIGTLLPVLPGAPVIWSGMLVYALITGFEQFSLWFFIAQALLAAAVMGVDYLFVALGSRYFGGSKAAFWGAAAGLFVGLFFFPFGLVLGPFIGAALADLIYRRKTGDAIKSGTGATLGFLGALPLKLFIEAIMIIWFIIRIL